MHLPSNKQTLSLTVIIPVLNSAELLSSTLSAIGAGSRIPEELVVVDDASSDSSADIARAHGTRVLTMPRNSGPAACRNYAASQTRGDILVFLDADTRVHVDTIALLAARLEADLSLDAVIGAYDEVPAEQDACSQFHNLAHCFVHRASAGEARTFRSGCGAIRRTAFLRVGGFDERYKRPSVEDIELGYRMTAQGARILLDATIMVTHLKRWTARSAVITNVRDRGIPWMLLLLGEGHVPDDLNLTWRHRASAALTGLALFAFTAARVLPLCVLLALGCAAAAMALQFGMLRFVCRGKSMLFGLSAVAFCFLQEVCKVVAFLGGAAVWMLGPARVSRGTSSLLTESRAAPVSESTEVPA